MEAALILREAVPRSGLILFIDGPSGDAGRIGVIDSGDMTTS